LKKSILVLFICLIPVLALAQTPEEYFFSGFDKTKISDWKGALQDFNKAIELNPNFEEAYVGRAIVMMHMGDNKGALLELNKAINLNPNLSDAYGKL